tara:strand:+ start:2718 stop:2915 length:198 start_codon:yes stop_codon:yes gene_type:complete
MTHKFTEDELKDIKQIVDANGEWGIRSAFYWWNGVAKDKSIKVEDVEIFSIAFMSQYNEQFGFTY